MIITILQKVIIVSFYLFIFISNKKNKKKNKKKPTFKVSIKVYFDSFYVFFCMLA